MHQSYKTFNLLRYLLKQFLVLRCQSYWCLIHLVKAKIFLNRFGLLLNVLLKNLTEKVLQFDNWMIVHGGKMRAKRIYLHWVLWVARSTKDAQANNIVLHEVPQSLFLISHDLGRRRLSKRAMTLLCADSDHTILLLLNGAWLQLLWHDCSGLASLGRVDYLIRIILAIG